MKFQPSLLSGIRKCFSRGRAIKALPSQILQVVGKPWTDAGDIGRTTAVPIVTEKDCTGEGIVGAHDITVINFSLFGPVVN